MFCWRHHKGRDVWSVLLFRQDCCCIDSHFDWWFPLICSWSFLIVCVAVASLSPRWFHLVLLPVSESRFHWFFILIAIREIKEPTAHWECLDWLNNQQAMALIIGRLPKEKFSMMEGQLFFIPLMFALVLWWALDVLWCLQQKSAVYLCDSAGEEVAARVNPPRKCSTLLACGSFKYNW